MASNNTTISTVSATQRTGKFNKNHARRVRREGLIPAVLYGAGGPSVAVAVDPKIITRILHSNSGHNSIFDLAIEGGATGKAMIVDWQNEPIKGHLLHIDLKRIAMDKKMQVSVPVQLIGVAVGVKNSGGILLHVLHEVEIECLPGDIPSHIDVDVSNLEMNQSLHISDLPHSDKIEYLGEEDAVVASVTYVKAEAEPEAVVAAETPAEPEVVKKGKQETAEGEAKPEAKK
ncbi:MAG TPA: 50S ribosomal protein L25 [Acidobacteriaceae bacterium]|nr:50S ribosomal protein L25 [Acidobacteriaceae bacterium]